jgi:hypothetical protein
MKLTLDFGKNKTKNCAKRYIGAILDAARKNVSGYNSKDLIRSHDSIRRSLLEVMKNPEVITAEMIHEAKVMNREKRGYLIVDNTTIQKPYAKKIEGVALNHCGSELVLGISLTVALFVNDDGMIAVGSFVWQPGDQPRVQTATDLAIRLSQQIGCEYVLKDGLFSSRKSLAAYASSATHYVMRMHSNRVVSIDGVTTNLSKHPAFKMQRNQRQIVREAEWHGLKIRIVALKLLHRSKGTMTLFLVTNMPFKKAKSCARYYKNRWKIETLFRDLKQNFSLNASLSRSIRAQHAHCIAIFAAHRISHENTVVSTKSASQPRKVRTRMKISRTRMTRSIDPIRSSPYLA